MVGVNTNLVGQNESSGLEGPLFGDGRPLDVGSQTDSGRALSGGLDSTRCDLLDVFTKLNLIYKDWHLYLSTNFIVILISPGYASCR